MQRKTSLLEIDGIVMEIVRKDMKTLRLSVHPPEGRVRVSVPRHVGDEFLRKAVMGRLGWIRAKQAKYRETARQAPAEYVSGETHRYLGREYRLVVVHGGRSFSARMVDDEIIELSVRRDSNPAAREKALSRWYADRLREIAAPLLEKWQARLGVRVESWGFRRMRSRWGSCSPSKGRVTLNLELAKAPIECIEYVIVHELAHLLVPSHDKRFRSLVETHYPDWKRVRAGLNGASCR